MKKLKLLLLIVFITSTLNVISYAQNDLPDKVRVGLYYLQKSLDCVELSVNEGFDIGYNSNDTYKSLFKDSTIKNILVKKDFYTSESTTTSAPAFHISIDKTYSSYDLALKQANIFIGKSYKAFPVYENGWKVWVGIYKSSTDADKDVVKIKKDFAKFTYSVIKPSDKRIQVLTKDNKIKLIFSSENSFLEIYPILSGENPNIIGVNGKNYRGCIRIIRQQQSDMTIMNVVGLEQYLYSVAASEMPSSWNIEALKAQTLAARTYAIKCLQNVQEGKGAYISLGIDMNGTTEFQAYNGYSSECENSRKAVDETKGLVMYYDNQPISAYFFSSDGGYTEGSENVWSSPLPYLKPVEDKYQPADFNKKNWSNKATPEEIKNYFASKGLDIGDITDVKVIKYSKSGNALELKISGTKGEKIYLKDNIRAFMGGSFLFSQTFTINNDGQSQNNNTNVTIIDSTLNKKLTWIQKRKLLNKDGQSIIDPAKPITVKTKDSTKTIKPTQTTSSTPKTFVFNGRGWGHGVGMSQYGAKGMADAGFKFDEILKHYYSGIEIK